MKWEKARLLRRLAEFSLTSLIPAAAKRPLTSLLYTFSQKTAKVPPNFTPCNVRAVSASSFMSALREKFLAFRVYRYTDREAYGEIYDLFADRIRRFLIFKLPRPEDADELTSEVFLRGWEYMSSGTVNNLNAFFFRIARNLVADFYRKYKATDGIEAAETIDAGVSVEEGVATKIAGDELLETLRTLKDEYREVLVMRYLSEMEVGEIASALEKTSNSVRVLLHRAKKALQEKVETSKS